MQRYIFFKVTYFSNQRPYYIHFNFLARDLLLKI